jgi:tetratricopeptide (TPR) repeat protein
MRSCILLATLIFFTAFTSFSQTFNDALGALKNNNLTEAKQAFEKIKSNEQDAANALLALTLIESNNGRYEQAFDYFAQFFDKSPNPYPYVYALWTSGIFSGGRKTNDRQIAFFTKIVNDPRADVTIKAMAADNIAGIYKSITQLSDSKKWYAKIGDLKNWSSVGTFQNVSASGFNKDFGVLAHPEAAYQFTNNTGAKVTWFPIADARNDRWLDYNYHYDISNSVIYAQTFLNSDKDQDVTFLLGVSGSFKVWVNDFLIGSEQEERNTDLDVYQYAAKLQQGYNRILVQIGSSELNSSNFLLRVADAAGNLVTNLPTTRDVQPYKSSAAYTPKSFKLLPEKFFEEKLETAPTFLDKLMLVNVYNHNDKRYEAQKLARQLKTEAPVSTLISKVLIETYSRDNNNTDVNKEIEFVKTNDSTSLYGLVLLYNDAKDREDYNEARRLLDKRVATYGKNADTEAKLIDILAAKKDYETLIKEIDVAYKQYPDEEAFVSLQYTLTQNVTKDIKKANEVLINYLKNNYNISITKEVIDNKLKQGKVDDAFKQYKQLLEDLPHATMDYTRIADKYFEIKDYDNALKWEQMAIDRAPYAGSFRYKKGVIYEAAGKKTEAYDAYKKAIEYNPSDYDARRKLRELEGKKDLFKYFRENDINAAVKNAPAASAYPNDNSVFLLKDLQQVVYPENGASEERTEKLIKILNQEGINTWKEVGIPYNSYSQRLIIEKAEIIKKDGSKVPAETNENQLVFSSLEVGDAIHFLYKLETSVTGKLAEHFWEDFNFTNAYPVLLSRYSLIVPTAKVFRYKMYNSDMKPEITDVDGNKLYIWERKNATAIQSEPYMPPFTDVVERVVVTSIPDWNYVANWYSDLSNIKAKNDFEIKEKVKEILGDKKGLTDYQKARLFYDYIEENLNYSDVPFLHSALTPQRASRTLRTRLGDCKDLSTLFVAMCKEAGINANLVLVDTRDNGDYNLDLPTIGFNHCIAQLNTGNKNYLIELTDNHLPFGSMGYHVENANGLYIPAEGKSTADAALVKLNTANRPVNYILRNTTINFKGETADIERKNTRFGAEASGIRSSYKNKGETDRKKDMLSSLSSEFNRKVNLRVLTLSSLDDLADSVNMNYAFSVEKFTTALMGIQIFKLPWSDAYNSLDFVAEDKRFTPFTVWKFSNTKKDIETITVTLPAGKLLAEVPKDVSLKHPAILYRLTYKIKQGVLQATREVNYLKDYVSVEEYASFKELITQMNEADARQYGYK